MENSAKFDDIMMTNSKVRDQYDQENNRGEKNQLHSVYRIHINFTTFKILRNQL